MPQEQHFHALGCTFAVAASYCLAEVHPASKQRSGLHAWWPVKLAQDVIEALQRHEHAMANLLHERCNQIVQAGC